MILQLLFASLILLSPLASDPPSDFVKDQNCNYSQLGYKKGTVYGKTTGSMMPDRPACQNAATVTITKRGGKAKATAYIYRADSERDKGQLIKTFEFARNAANTTKTFTANNVLYKCIRVEIKNKSVGDTFKYTAKATQVTS